MPDSIVLELQRDALDPTSDIAELVRKAYTVATKLGLEDFRVWAKGELDGFLGKQVEVPAYRVLQADVRAWNPYHGWIPFLCEDPDEAKSLARAPCGMPIAQIQHLVQSKEDGQLRMPFSPAIKAQLMRQADLPLEPTRLVDRSQLASMVEAVRNVVLEWTLELERQGVLGEGITFSSEDKVKAQATNALHVENLFQGSVTAVGSAIGSGCAVTAQDISHSVTRSATLEDEVKGAIQKAIEHVQDEELSDEDRSDVLESIDKLRSELEKTERSPARIGRFWKRVKEIAPTVGTILSSAKTLADILKSAGAL